MAHSKLYMEHIQTGLIKEAPVGFSWTSFFFGLFVPAVRQDWVTAIVLVAVTCGLSVFGLPFVVGICQSFFYNSYYIQKLVEKGYAVRDSEGMPLDMIQQKLGMRLPMIDKTTLTEG